MMQIPTVFFPMDKVYIPDIDTMGIVLAVRITVYGTEYLVRYVMDGSYCEGYLYDFEVKQP